MAKDLNRIKKFYLVELVTDIEMQLVLSVNCLSEEKQKIVNCSPRCYGHFCIIQPILFRMYKFPQHAGWRRVLIY